MIKNFNIVKLSSLITVISLLVLSACAHDASRPSEPKPETEQPRTISESDRVEYQNAINALNNNQLAKAQRLFSQFIHNKPGLAGAYANLALIHFKKNEFDKSLVQVNKALALNADKAQALNLRAKLFVHDGKIHKAKDDYLKAIKLKPEYINAHYNLALLYDVYLQEITLAIEHYKIYLSLLKEPDTNTEAWVEHLERALKND